MGMDLDDGLGPVPPTPANAPKGDVDWSVHTKRMLADIKPRLMKKNAEPLKVSQMTGLTAAPSSSAGKKKKTRGSTRGSARSAESDDDDEEGVGKAASPCKRAEAARIFYQVLVR